MLIISSSYLFCFILSGNSTSSSTTSKSVDQSMSIFSSSQHFQCMECIKTCLHIYLIISFSSIQAACLPATAMIKVSRLKIFLFFFFSSLIVHIIWHNLKTGTVGHLTNYYSSGHWGNSSTPGTSVDQSKWIFCFASVFNVFVSF